MRVLTAAVAGATAALVAGLVAGCGGTETGAPVAQPSTSSTTTGAPATSAVTATTSAAGGCRFTATPADPAARPVEPPPAAAPSKAGTVTVTFRTNHGDIPVTLDRAKAPCTVHSIEHLTKSKFYDDTPCHRLVSATGFQVLQCGDPTGRGVGGPGYTVPDEKPTGLPPAPGPPGAVVYPRGAIAMANSGQPDSGGSQFFFVIGDTALPPDYSIFGTVGDPGLRVLDAIDAAGVDPATDNGRGDGAPKLKTTITQAVVTA